MQVKAAGDLCLGAGNCAAITQQSSHLTRKLKPTFLNTSSVDGGTPLEADEICPENAIIVKDDEGHQIIPLSLRVILIARPR